MSRYKEKQSRLPLDNSDSEGSLIARLLDHGVTLSSGYATPVERVQRFREAILEAGLDCTIVGKHAGKCETYSDYFQRHFGEPLSPKKGKRA